jgi:hypothetical protein
LQMPKIRVCGESVTFGLSSCAIRIIVSLACFGLLFEINWYFYFGQVWSISCLCSVS